MKIRNISLFLIVFFSSIAFSQEIGKIYSKDEADSLFGKVIESAELSVSDLNSLLTQSQNNIMFSIVDNQLILLGDNRKVLSPTTKDVSDSDIFAVCSISKLLELLNYGDDSKISFEKRLNNPTITFGAHTLEDLVVCPPYCP
jgi:hypothetical protein